MYRFRLIRGRLGSCESELIPTDTSSIEVFSRSEMNDYVLLKPKKKKKKKKRGVTHQIRFVYEPHPNRPLANSVAPQYPSGTNWTPS
jgi:hypothetical protein